MITRLRIGHTKATNTICLPEDKQLLASIVARLWPLNTHSWNVQCCNKVMMSTTQLIRLGSSLRRSRSLALLNVWEKLYSIIWDEWSYIQYSSLFKSVTNWRHSLVELIPTTEHHHWNPFIEHKQLWENPTCEGRLICPEGRVDKCNPIQSWLVQRITDKIY